MTTQFCSAVTEVKRSGGGPSPWFGVVACSLLVGALLACTNPENPAEVANDPPDDAQSRPGIAWFEGDVETAFAKAQDSAKPIFLYWGAEWCPPCQQLKSTVFRQPEFIERTNLFVSVYLDADEQDAQRQAERFGITGYPTMVVFDSRGAELTRVPGGMNLQQYADVLDLVGTTLRPIGSVLQAVLTGEKASDQDFRLLAYYHWLLDNQQVLAGLDSVATLRRVYELCPSRMAEEKGRLLVDYLQTAAFADGLEPMEQGVARAELVSRLDDRNFVRTNAQYLSVFTAQIAETVSTAGSPGRNTLSMALVSALDGLATDEAASKTDRVYAVQGKVALALSNAPGAPLRSILQDEARTMAAWADRVTVDPAERQSTVYAAGFLLESAGLYEDAERLLLEEIRNHPSPKYFELLSDLASDQGKLKQAIEWMKRAFLEARGSASRFEFGVGFVATIAGSTPFDLSAVENGTDLVLDELEPLFTALYGRTKTQLQRLDAELKQWAKGEAEREAVLQRLRLRTQKRCAELEPGPSRETCDAFLSIF